MLVILVLFLSPIFLSIVIFLMSVAPHIIIFVNYVKLGPLLTVTLPFFWLMLLFLLSLIIAILSSIIFQRTLLVGLRVQNFLARVVVSSTKRCHHISPVLANLHWLPVKQRIEFKIVTITFKTLQNKQPYYLSELLHPYIPNRSLRSSDKHLLHVPLVKTALGRRSFSYAAPFIWNTLPLSLRTAESLSTFTSHLKTFLFPP